MATYTMELRNLVARHDIGLRDYPIFDEGHRLPLNKKIVDHYLFREIGHETSDLFIFALNRKMNEIMPYYNQIYLSERLKFDPLLTIDIHSMSESSSTSEQTTDSNSTNSATTDNKSRSVASDTPQTQLSGDGDYASSLTDSTAESTVSGEGSDAATASGVVSASDNGATRGRQGSAGSLLVEWRAAMLNVDMAVVGELGELFMGVWNNGDIESSYIVPGVMPSLYRFHYGF